MEFSMITSAQMLRSAKEQIEGFKAVNDEILSKRDAGEIAPSSADLNVRNNEAIIEEIGRNIAEYESLKSGSSEYIQPRTIADIPRTITQLRLLLGWSQEQLANEIGVAQQQIARYEATDYAGASFERVLALVEAFGAHISIEKIRLMFDEQEDTRFMLPKGVSKEKALEDLQKIHEAQRISYRIAS